MAAQKQPWDRQPGEGAKPYASFLAYKEMGRDRSLAKVGRQSGKDTSLMERWSSKYSWVSRVEAWDMELERVKREEEINAIRDMRRRQLDLALGGQGLVALELQKHIVLSRANPTTPTLTADQCQRIGEWATKLERQNRGDGEGSVTVSVGEDGAGAEKIEVVFVRPKSNDKS